MYHLSMQKTKKVEFEAIVREHKGPLNIPHKKYGRITSNKLGVFAGRKVRIIVEEIREKA